ncbi:MAG TPA: tripartite tricarboxylate transporter substrate binding protein [Burkholderiales bacterium]|nr:tripartite tricarboxylate transporter substrate binding protein [Burkholderiales bacterium]
MRAPPKRLAGSVLAIVVSATVGTALGETAASYPSKPIRFVITYPAGGGSDYTVRPIAQKLYERWGQPAIVESRAGGSAMIGTDFVVRSPPDGYTVLLSASSEVSMNVALFKKMPYDPVRDLLPVTLVGKTPPVLLAHPSLPAKSVKELVALARSKPGALNYASIGVGTPQHFAGELMKITFRIDMTHVPYKGAAPALMDLVGGQVPIGLTAPTTAVPHIKAGRLRALAVTSAQRSGALPDVPTVAESGAPGFDIVQWYAIWLPAKAPADIAAKLHDEIVQIIQSPDYRQRQLEVATDIVASTPEALAAQQKADIEKYRRIAAAAGITPE